MAVTLFVVGRLREDGGGGGGEREAEGSVVLEGGGLREDGGGGLGGEREAEGSVVFSEGGPDVDRDEGRRNGERRIVGIGTSLVVQPGRYVL